MYLIARFSTLSGILHPLLSCCCWAHVQKIFSVSQFKFLTTTRAWRGPGWLESSHVKQCPECHQSRQKKLGHTVKSEILFTSNHLTAVILTKQLMSSQAGLTLSLGAGHLPISRRVSCLQQEVENSHCPDSFLLYGFQAGCTASRQDTAAVEELKDS